MATLLEIYRMQGDATLKNRITEAAAYKAWYILSTEPPETANHAARVTWAKEALKNPEAVANQIYWACLQNTDIQAGNPTDAQITYVTELAIDVLCIA